MLDIVSKDIYSILPHSFVAFGRTRKCLLNESTKVIYDDSVSGVETTLLILRDDNTDLSISDQISINNRIFKIRQIQIESRIMLRLFLKESNYYVKEKWDSRKLKD